MYPCKFVDKLLMHESPQKAVTWSCSDTSTQGLVCIVWEWWVSCLCATSEQDSKYLKQTNQPNRGPRPTPNGAEKLPTKTSGKG
jgi:hypothetical protein